MTYAIAYRKIFGLAEIILPAFILLAFSGAAHADAPNTQVWRDTQGVVVHNSFGECVRSRWDNNTDVCATQEPPPPPVQHHTVIAEEDRTIYFTFNKADLTDEAKNRLNSLAATLKSASDVQGAKVVGYADRIGSVTYNETLSKTRAMNVRDYLVAHEIVNTDVAQTHWVGKSEPTANCPKAKGKSKAKLIECLQPDRKVRVEIVYRTEVKDQKP